MRDLDNMSWTQKFQLEFTKSKEESETTNIILEAKMKMITLQLENLKSQHTELTSHREFSLLKTNEMNKDLIMTFYYECLECLQ